MNFNDIDNFWYFVRYSPYIHHRTAMASETSAIAFRSEEIRKEMPVATASGGGVANLSHDFYTPVFRRDVLWYGDVRPGLRPSVRQGSKLTFSGTSLAD